MPLCYGLCSPSWKLYSFVGVLLLLCGFRERERERERERRGKEEVLIGFEFNCTYRDNSSIQPEYLGRHKATAFIIIY